MVDVKEQKWNKIYFLFGERKNNVHKASLLCSMMGENMFKRKHLKKKKALFHIFGNCGKNYKLKSRFWRLKKIQGICDILFFAKIFSTQNGEIFATKIITRR